MKEKGISLNLISLTHGIFFCVVGFFAICFGNPQYNGSVSKVENFPFIYAIWAVALFGFLFLLSFFTESLLSGDVRVYISSGISFAEPILFLLFALAYLNKKGDLDPSFLIPRVALILAGFVFLSIPVGLNFKRFQKPALFLKTEEWKRFPFLGLLFASGEVLCLLVLLCVNLLLDSDGVPLGSGASLVLVCLSLGVAVCVLGYWGYLLKKESLLDEKALAMRMLYLAIIQAILPFVAFFASLYLYENGPFPYQVYFYSLLLYSASILFSLGEALYAVYINKGEA